MSFIRNAAVLLAVTGCTESTVFEPEPPTERTISARESLGFRAGDGTSTELPVDLDTAVVQAYVRDAAGAWSVHAGEGTSAGTLAVRGAPLSPAWLRVDYFDPNPEAPPRNELFHVGETDADVELDLRTWRAGRAEMRHATTVPTQTVFRVSGLAPWQPGWDLLVITSPAASFTQVFSQNADGISGLPDAGATASTLQADWASAVGGPLLDGTRGDRAYALQLRFHERGGMFVGAPVRAVALPAFTQHDGTTTDVDTPLAVPAEPLRAQIAMDRDAFDALRPAIGLDVTPAVGRGFSIYAAASDVTAGFSRDSLPAELLVLEGEPIVGSGPFDLGSIDIASPFPLENVFTHAASAYRVKVERDDGLVAYALAEVGVITSAVPSAGAPAAPLIGPVRNVTIDGRDAFTAPHGVGVTPVVAWDPPALGTPVEYEVKILAPGGVDPNYDFVWYPSAIFHVPGTQTELALPPEILQPEFPYALAIRAITHGSSEATAIAPRQIALPYGWADTITPAFKP